MISDCVMCGFSTYEEMRAYPYPLCLLCSLEPISDDQHFEYLHKHNVSSFYKELDS